MESENWASEITRKGLSFDVITYNILITGYSSAGNIQKALGLYETMKQSGIKPTLNTYHRFITGCGKEGLMLVEKIYQEMLEMNLVPDRVLYNALIHCYVEHKDVQKACSLHSAMEAQAVQPDRMTYNCLILGHFKEGKRHEVKDLVNNMKTKGLFPKTETYDILTEGHCKLKDFSGAYA